MDHLNCCLRCTLAKVVSVCPAWKAVSACTPAVVRVRLLCLGGAQQVYLTLPSGRVTCQQLMGGWWLICSTDTCVPANSAWKVSPSMGLKGFRVLVCRLRPPTTNATSNFILQGARERLLHIARSRCATEAAQWLMHGR